MAWHTAQEADGSSGGTQLFTHEAQQLHTPPHHLIC